MKKNRIIISLLLCGIFNSAVFARGNQELVPAGSWVYDSIEAISLDAGVTNFADCAPLSIQELKIYLSEIDVSGLSEQSAAEYKKVQEYFDFEYYGIKSDLLSCGIEPAVNLEGFYKQNDDIDWVYDRYSRQPFIDFPVAITCGDIFTMKMDAHLAQNKTTALKNDRYSNVPVSEDDIDINFPDNSFFSTGYMVGEKTGIGFQAGKGSRNIGDSLTGSIIWSQYLTGVSYAQLTAYSPNFKYTGAVSQFNVDRYMYTHQFDARFGKKLTVTALEGIFVNAPMELRFLNPFTIFHGMAPWREYDDDSYDSESHTCAYLGLKFIYVPVRNLKIYGLYAMTQYQTPYEVKNNPDDTTPNGIGAQLGTQYSVNVKKGRLVFGFEGSYAQPYLYIKESPNWSLVRTYCDNMGEKKYPFYEWIGSPFGPDTVGGEAKVSYQVPDKWSVDLIYLFMARGEMSGDGVFYTDGMTAADGRYKWGGLHITNTTTADAENGYDGWCYPYGKNGWTEDECKKMRDLTVPTGTPEYVNRISLKGIYKFNSNIECCFQPSYVLIFNHNHQTGKKAQGVEVAAAISYKF